MKKFLGIIAAILLSVGIFGVIGTVGAEEVGRITSSECTVRALIYCGMALTGAILSKVKEIGND